MELAGCRSRDSTVTEKPEQQVAVDSDDKVIDCRCDKRNRDENEFVHDSGGFQSCGKISQCVIVENVGDRVSDRSHDLLHWAVGTVGIGTVAAFLVGSLADAADRGERAIENADDVTQRNVFRLLDEAIPPLGASLT